VGIIELKRNAQQTGMIGGTTRINIIPKGVLQKAPFFLAIFIRRIWMLKKLVYFRIVAYVEDDKDVYDTYDYRVKNIIAEINHHFLGDIRIMKQKAYLRIENKENKKKASELTWFCSASAESYNCLVEKWDSFDPLSAVSNFYIMLDE
jgi:hypothetical protein